MQTQLTHEEIKRIIFSELPKVIETDRDIHRFILKITKERYADREKTEDRIDRILAELKQDREENFKKWEENKKQWGENQKQWGENQKRWDENQKNINEMIASIKSLSQKHDSTIGALGSRWGLNSENAFREGLRSILEGTFGVKVERYQDFDHEGTVFGHPDQIEMDVIIFNGTLILCEIKSSVSKSDIYAFWRKTNFYQEKHRRKADRMIVISPMTDKTAKAIAERFGIEIFGYADEVTI